MSLLLNIIPFFWLCCLGLVCCYLTRKKILWNESWWNEFYRLLIPSLFILREESMPFDSPTHLSFSQCSEIFKKKVQFLKILILILIRKEFHFFCLHFSLISIDVLEFVFMALFFHFLPTVTSFTVFVI